MKNKPLFYFRKDLWVVLCDIIAVNLSYFMAIVMRYYLRYSFVPEAADYLKTFWKFAPIYTVLCIVVFLLFRLYNGLWRYASLSDLNSGAGVVHDVDLDGPRHVVAELQNENLTQEEIMGYILRDSNKDINGTATN